MRLAFLSSPLLLLLGATGASASIFFDPTAVVHRCVDADGTTLTAGVPQHLQDVDTTYAEQTILLKPITPDTVISSAGNGITIMCVLHRWTLPLEDKAAGKGYYYPLGRSVPSVPAEAYGNATGAVGDWTRPPGKASDEVEYVCGEAGNTGANFNAGEYLCEVTLPSTSKPNWKDPTITDYNNVPYYLTYYERTMSVRNEISRFLQKNTFGPTASELDALEAAFIALQTGGNATLSHAEAMAQLQRDWVAAQMDPSTFTEGQFSSLRRYWRRRLNPRKEETYRIGESGPHPCEKHSRWRRFAFTNFDVQNAKMLRWGNQDLGGSYQTQKGHRITVETREYVGPVVEDGAMAMVGNGTGAPTRAPSTGVPSRSPVAGLAAPTAAPTMSWMPTISAAPTMANIIAFGDMEGTPQQINAQWPGRCDRTLVTNATGPVYSGEKSLYNTGGKRCFTFRPMSPACGAARVTDPLRAGDTLLITAKVRVEGQAKKIFEMYTRHYHVDKGRRRWAIPKDDSHMISRTLIPEADTWTTVTAVHKVGDDWGFQGAILTPERCNHYHLRFRLAGTSASYYLDDVRISKIGSAANGTTPTIGEDVPTSGFFANPSFDLGHSYWKYSNAAGYIRRDNDLNKNVLTLGRGKVMAQNVVARAIPGKAYQFGFRAKLTGAASADVRILVRMRFANKASPLSEGPCPKKVCNFWLRPFRKTIPGGNWGSYTSLEFDMFNYTEWEGEASFILVQMYARDLDPAASLDVTDFEVFGDDYTDAPSQSLSPSASPTNLEVEHVGYIVRYAGEIRTVLRYPFQIDKSGEVLPMDGSMEYQLCEVDEVEGRKAEFPNRMNFFIDGRCQPIRHGNPEVDIDPNFVNQTELHLLDLSGRPNVTITPINVEQTFEGDWLLETAVQDDVCAGFPDPYDNDYRGADEVNPDDIPTRFVPDRPVFAKLPTGQYALFDSRLILHGNTIDDPVKDGGGPSVLRSTIRAQRDGFKTLKYPWAEEYYVFNDHNIALCANEQPNFLNQDKCVVSYEENVCVKEYLDTTNTLVDVQLVVTFDDETLANFHNATRASYLETGIDNSRYLYAVDGLRWDDSVINGNITVLPCVPENPVSRWLPRLDLNASECTNTLTEKSNAAFVHALESSNDDNPYLRDIYLWNDLAEDGCDEIDYDQYGMLVMTSEGCWENMHPDYMSIYDFTGYEATHLSLIANITNETYITNWTTTGVMVYPANHPMSYFEELKEKLNGITAVARYSYASTSRVNQGARYGDSIVLDQMADQMRLNNDPIMLGAMAKDIAKMKLANKVATNRGGGTLVCGSPNEVAPDPTLDDYFDVIHRDLACIGCQDSYGDYDKQKVTVWAINAIEGEDQLCQRNAWSLYELLNVGAASNPDNTESNLYTYDIMTRHCFGNYFDILKEMTFSPKMGEQFNFAESTSTRLQWDTSGTLVYPDENYAREIMQLYTVGLHELNPDGTEVRDEFGRFIQTYTNVDILSNGRLFTGFTFTARRGNVEELFRSEKSRMDPLRIEVDKHDFFPKSSLDGNWIGDRVPLCVDLPRHHFLKKKATYRFRGSSSLPRVHYNPVHWDSDESIKRFVLDQNSGLYQQLCNPDGDGNCRFATTVTLDTNLACYGKECRIDDMEVVQVQPGAFYEYHRQPCVDLSFYDNPKKVITGFSPWVRQIGRRHTHAMCANPRSAVAARSCCNVAANMRAEYNYDFEYHGERVTLATNLDQCLADNGTVCDPVAMKADNPLVNIRPVYNFPYPSQNTFFWTDSDCTQLVKVREDGMIAIINQPATNPWFYDDTVPYVDVVNTVNFISVKWETDNMTFKEIYPSMNNTCGEGACSITADDACLCEVTLSETPAFNVLPSRDDVLSMLKIGAFDPDTFSDSEVTYSLLESSNGVDAFVASDSGVIGASSTIFKVVDDYGDTVFLKNMASSITLGGEYTLRNPPSYINLVKVELRDAEYEVDEFLRHLIRYPSAAPFICKKLAQYHGIANPSPGLVQRVTQAFKTGSFTSGGETFGSGEYGDLKAVAAAISLDPESLSPVIDEDPISGNIREPLLKVIQFMRSLSFERRPHVKFRHGLFDNMPYKIGQMVFHPPDQFSFFSSDYSPPGVHQSAGLVSPESELLSMSSVVGLTNGLFSFVNYGLAHADGGFGPNFNRLPPVGDHSTAMGIVTFPYQTSDGTDVASTIDELSTMLTAGRLSEENKQVLVNAHTYFSNNHGVEFADRVLLKLMTATPEYHTSNTVRKTGSPRPITPPQAKSSSPYKAIVYINLSGGADSFNILSPGSTGCSLHEEYLQARGGPNGIGLKGNEMLHIDGSSAGISGCGTFGVNKLLPAYKDIFEEGKGVFFANMGHLHKPVTKDNWLTETRTDLFSHHTMKLESHAVDAFREGDGPGVLGRMLDILAEHGHAVAATAVNSRPAIIDGSPTTGRLADIMSTDGLPRMFDRNFLKGEENQQLREFLESLHAETDDNSGVFGNAWSQTFVDVWNKTDSLVAQLRGSDLATSFPTPAQTNVGGIASQLKLIANLINIRNERGKGINRDIFYCDMGGYDSHFQVKTVLDNKFPSLNHAVASFWAEIKAQGLANNVVVVQGSEFGRTITQNSNAGSDHAWGGNYFMFGGDVKGGKIMGEYPQSFHESDPTNIGRGRLVPTTSWDALFYGLSQWMGITDQDELDHVLPNSQNFGCNLFTDYDLFNSGQQVLNGCGGATHTTPITFQVPEVRQLTGEEQKQVCKLAMRSTSLQLNFDRSKARCYVADQTIVDSEIAPGMYDVNGLAILNFDGTIPASSVSPDKVAAISKAAAATASDFVIAGALPQSEAPSGMPSMQPSISAEPSMQPSTSAAPSSQPSLQPSMMPSISSQPSLEPSISSRPSGAPTAPPSISQSPSMAPTISIAPSISFEPTPSPTARKVFEEEFLSRDIGYVGYAGQSLEAASGLYHVQGSGSDIWGSSDNFHYMYLETSGDATFTVLIEGFQAGHSWAKGGIMFRSSLSSSAGHYSLYQSQSNGLANQFRTCNGCYSYHYGNYWTRYSSVWLRVVKVGNVLKSFYKPSYSSYWTQFGVERSMAAISSNGYYIGVAVTSHSNANVATLMASNIQLTRTCSSETITQLQCDQASNCDSGAVSGGCYNKGEVPPWESLEPVSNVLDLGSTTTKFGCNGEGKGNNALDGTTNKFTCDREGLLGESTGLVIIPHHRRSSIAEGLRVYASNNCPDCDPVSYIFEGRVHSDGDWVQISQGDLPWKTATKFPRNSVLGRDIDGSTYDSGDSSFDFTEVSFYNHDYETCGTPALQKDYRGTIASTRTGRTCQNWDTQFPHSHSRTDEQYPGTGLGNHNYCRNPDGESEGAWCYTTDAQVRWEYCDVPDCEDDPATLTEYWEYKVTWTATRNPGNALLQLAELEVPGLLGAEPPMPTLEYTGDYVPSIIQGSTEITLLGGYSSGTAWNQQSIDSSTNKFYMYRDSETVNPGMLFSPSHGRLSVVTGLRIYTANNNPGADPAKYRILGRTMAGANVHNRHYQPSKCWAINESNQMVAQDCDSSNIRQRFYLNELGEIRVKSHPGYCVDPRYGMSSSYLKNYIIQCYSDLYGQDYSYAQFHKFNFREKSEEFESVYYPGNCIDYNFNNGNMYMHGCHGENNQRHYFTDGSFFGGEEDAWQLIDEGNLPWISEFDRNPSGIEIGSTYETADPDMYVMEVRFLENTTPYDEYRVRFTETRDPESTMVQFAELELPGLLLA